MVDSREPHFAMSLRLKPATGRLLEQVAKEMGLNKTSVIVVALHDLARSRGITVPQDEEKEEAGS